MAMKRGRKAEISLSDLEDPRSDYDGDEALYRNTYRGHPDIKMLFHIYDPRWLEEQEELASIERCKQEARRDLIRRILSKVDNRQKRILVLRSEHNTFDEIAVIVGVSVRTIYGDWKKIRTVANECVLEQLENTMTPCEDQESDG